MKNMRKKEEEHKEEEGEDEDEGAGLVVSAKPISVLAKR